METAIVSVVCIALMVIGGMTMSQGILSTADTTRSGIVQTSQREQDIVRTNITLTSARKVSSSVFEVKLTNTGHTKLNNYSKWDVIIQYYSPDGSHHVQWLPFTEGVLADNQWRLVQISADESGAPEEIDPGIVNPGEQATLEGRLNPLLKNGTTNIVMVSTPNGITASTTFK